MKTLFKFVIGLVFITMCLVLVCAGCSENPVNPIQSDKTQDTISIGIVSNYGYCDSLGCYGESVFLFYKITLARSLSYIDTLSTLDSYLVTETGLVLPFENNLLYYYSTCNAYISIGSNYIYFNGQGVDTLNLDFNTHYRFDYGKYN